MEHALRANFDMLAMTLPATVGVAIIGADTGPMVVGDWSCGVAWSTIKVPLAIAAVRAGSASADQLFATITRSDNTAAEELWSQLGDDAAAQVQSVIQEAGDANTVVEARRLRAGYTPFGQTRWSLPGQARFAAGLSEISGASPVMNYLHALCDDHRWGMAAKGCAAKGGWGPGIAGGYLVRQFAVVSGHVGVALAADAGDYDTGVSVVNTLADWVDEALAHQ